MADSALSKVKLWRQQEKLQKLNKLLFKRWKTGEPLSSKCKQILLNVYSNIQNENANLNAAEVAEKTSVLTGVGSGSISAARREIMQTGKTTTPGRCRPKRVGKYIRVNRYEDLTLSLIRRKVHEFYSRREIPTMHKVLQAVNVDGDLPDFQIRTFSRLMNDIGFTCMKRKRNSILIDREDIMLWRHQYLRTIKQYRQENRKIFYLDETWINVVTTKQNVSYDTSITTCCKPAFTEGVFLTELKLPPPSGVDKRLLLLHVGSQDGFVENVLCLFHPKKQGDSHEEMTGDYFETWFKTKLIPNLPPNSVIVLDNAACHSVKHEEFPTKIWKKCDVQQWLASKNVEWTDDMFKAELLNLAEPYRATCNQFRIDIIVRDAGHVILRLPPYHSELNPMEEVFASIKGYVAANSTASKMGDNAEKLIKEAIGNVTPELWFKYVQHVKRIEGTMWKIDCLIEKISERLIVNSEESMSESSTSDDEETNRSQLNGVDAVFDLCFAEMLSSDGD